MFNANMELKDRIRAAREEAGLTRPELFEKTEIPVKSIEKIETGHMVPTIDRIKKIAETCNVAFNDLIQEPTAENSIEENLDRAEKSLAENSEENEKSIDDKEIDFLEAVNAQLNNLDGMRKNGFENSIRTALATMDHIKSHLQFLEPGELLGLAKERGVNIDDCPSVPAFMDIFTESIEKAQNQCAEIEMRIIDTAIFGEDLYSIGLDELKEIAEEYGEGSDQEEGFKKTGWGGFSWGDQHQFISKNRNVMRRLALNGDLEFKTETSNN